MGDPRGFDLLTQALQSDNELVKTAAIGALGELGDERAVAVLLPYATDRDWQIRHRVAQALSHFNTAEARSALERLSQDEVVPVAQEAKQSLGS